MKSLIKTFDKFDKIYYSYIHNDKNYKSKLNKLDKIDLIRFDSWLKFNGFSIVIGIDEDDKLYLLAL